MEMVLDRVCANCGSDRHSDERFCLFCGDVLTNEDDKSRTSSPSAVEQPSSKPATYDYAGFWLRFWAGAVDVAIEALGALVVTLLAEFVMRGFGVDRWNAKVFAGFAYVPILAIGSWLYCAFMESSSWRATIGKRLFGLEVITTNGDRLSFGQATARHFMKFLSLFTATIGFLMAGWTERRQALHDMPSDVLVIRGAQATFSLRNR